MSRAGEAVAAGLGGLLLGGLTGSLIGLTVPAAAIGAVNGAVCGWWQIYGWHSWSGRAAFVLDSTWGLVGTAAALVVHGFNLAAPGRDYRPGRGRRTDHHVYGGGFRIRRDFTITWGNVVSNAGGGRNESERERRIDSLMHHERLHGWQWRTLGPFFPVLYLGWMVAAGAVGAVVSLWYPGRRLAVMETLAYYDNHFEHWAYRRDGRLPPGRAVTGLTWRDTTRRR